MNISEKHIRSKRKIGHISGKAVVEVVTTGGLHLVIAQGDNNGYKTLGTGPHRAVARWIAQKNEPGLEITELSKSDSLDVHAMASVLPEWIRRTDYLRSLEE